MTKEVILITANFPYCPGEQFLETEIEYWGKTKNVHLTIMPIGVGTDKREIPKNISIDYSLIDKVKKNRTRIIYILKSLKNKIFYQEIYTQVLKNPKRFKSSLSSFAKYLFMKDKLEIFLNAHKNKNFIFYTYWHTETTYALQSLKKEYDFLLVTRTHRFDIYEERRKYQYMPLRRQFLNNIDKVYTITENAEEYLSETYGFDKNVIETSRLGVDDYEITTLSNEGPIYHIVSCSFLVEIKQLNKLIDAISKFSLTQKEVKMVWTHIGSGPIEQELKAYAQNRLDNISNILYCFLGEIENRGVYEFYKNNKVDVFINVSASEGAPVSIMEAMSCHIPIIAPDIGGISEMVTDGHNGVLLSKTPTIDEIANTLSRISYFKKKVIRENAYKIYQKKYNAKQNYNLFIKSILKLERI